MRNLLRLGNCFYKIPAKHMINTKFNQASLDYLLSINKKPENAVIYVCNLKCIHKCNACLGLNEYSFLDDYKEEEEVEIHINDFINDKND